MRPFPNLYRIHTILLKRIVTNLKVDIMIISGYFIEMACYIHVCLQQMVCHIEKLVI